MGKLYGAGTCVTLKGFQGMSQSRRKTGRGVRVGTLRTGEGLDLLKCALLQIL